MASPDVAGLLRRSVEVIEAAQASTGAYVGCPSFENYRFAWFRDGSFCAHGMVLAGRSASALEWHRWAAATVARNVAAADYLPARYDVEGRMLSDGWWDRQHDGYGTWLWVLGKYAARHGWPEECTEGAASTVAYLLERWETPCFDWWEEHDGHLHTVTLAAVAGGLASASGFEALGQELRSAAAGTSETIARAIRTRAVVEGRLVKWLDDGPTTDALLLACSTPFGIFAPEEPVMVATLEEIEAELVRERGVHRHPRDTFYGGGQWPLLGAWLGWHYLRCGRTSEARAQLEAVRAAADPDGTLPEQRAANLLHPEDLDEWLDRWGPSATPLPWAHAMVLVLAAELGLIETRESA